MSETVKIVLFANDPEETMLNNFIKSLKKYNYDYNVVGLGQKWLGFMTKINGYYEYAKSAHPDQLIVITDAYDVMANGPPHELIKSYKEYNKPLVVGCETYCGANCIPITNWWNERSQEKQGKLKYVNSGFFMARANYLVKVLSFMLSLGITDDQEALCIYVNKYPEDVALDTNTKLVSNITPFDFKYLDYDKENERVFNKLTNNHSAFIHTPGKTGDYMVRTNYIGEKILGKDYVKTPDIITTTEIVNKFPTFVKKNFSIIFFIFWISVIIIIILAAINPLLIAFFLVLALLIGIIFISLYNRGLI